MIWLLTTIDPPVRLISRLGVSCAVVFVCCFHVLVPVPSINAFYWLPVSCGSQLEIGSNRITQTLTLPSGSFHLVAMARYVPVEEQEPEHLKWMRLAMEMVCVVPRVY